MLKHVLTADQARFTADNVAYLLNTTTEGVYVIVSLKLIKPLGHPRRNCTRYFAKSYVLRLMEDEAWLARVTDALYQYKWDKNHGKVNNEDLNS